ncbi:molybdenum ABC transporter substrate-binding protein [Amycolatopsis sp. WAC 04182]|uniref:molybdenum ABC transporter substrate-binding protein n=1 Tax=Amycolatopsis sp. WAC 04182 TaxID=2203198 RepID=UPI000F77BBB9|nr:molybdenum ABC transporter substrate-binding protein [Amycolatopsis sp. WAC 04182]RSN61437.1 molybdenum ABC transporter substrate-binding protein [Amycolatopsis sp. WAC 04182]
MRIVTMVTLAAVVGLTTVSGCGPTGPSTRTEVCTTFDQLGEKLLGANGLYDNALFSKAEDLADAAGRYPGAPGLTMDSAALTKIADSNSTTGHALVQATSTIADLCGHPLGFGGMFGGKGPTGRPGQ